MHCYYSTCIIYWHSYTDGNQSRDYVYDRSEHLGTREGTMCMTGVSIWEPKKGPCVWQESASWNQRRDHVRDMSQQMGTREETMCMTGVSIWEPERGPCVWPSVSILEPEKRPCAWQESASPIWLVASGMNLCKNIHFVHVNIKAWHWI